MSKTGMHPGFPFGGTAFAHATFRYNVGRIGTMEWLRYVASPDAIWEEREKTQDRRNKERALSYSTKQRVGC